MAKLLAATTATTITACFLSSSYAHESGQWPDNFLFIESTAGGGPEQIWINYGQTPDTMVITWITNGTTTDAGKIEAVAGTTPGNYNYFGQAALSSYTTLGYTSGTIHRAMLTSLQVNTVYTYQVGSNSSGWSAPAQFTSHPGIGSIYPISFGVIGDLGQTNYSNATIYHVKSIQPQVNSVFITGDLSYADSDQPRWDSFGRLIQPLSSEIPIMTAPGNHELEITLPDLFLAYDTRFAGMPFPSGSADGPQYYSYNVGPAHMIVLNSFSVYSAGSAQYTFLQKDLASIDRSKTPWLFVILHAPWYTSNKVHPTDGQLMRETLESIVHDARCAAVFAGHVHAYERNTNVFNNVLDPSGPAYITIGDGGNREGLYNSWVDPQPAWSAYREAEYGHGVMTILNATHTFWEWHKNVDSEPVISDSAYFINPYQA